MNELDYLKNLTVDQRAAVDDAFSKIGDQITTLVHQYGVEAKDVKETLDGMMDLLIFGCPGCCVEKNSENCC